MKIRDILAILNNYRSLSVLLKRERERERETKREREREREEREKMTGPKQQMSIRTLSHLSILGKPV